MTLRSVFKLSERFIIDNAPTLLSAIAVTGVGTVAYLTGKATLKATRILDEEAVNRSLQELREDEPISKKDVVKLTWTCYIPPALAVAGTAGCIIFANSISASRLAGMAAAYKVVESQYGDYKDKVQEIFGEKKAEEVKDAVHADAVNAHRHQFPFTDDELLPDDALYPGTRRQWCFDLYSGRSFKSDMQTIRSYANDINMRLIEEARVPLSDFYDAVGLPDTKLSREIGWTLASPMELKFSSQLLDGNGGVPVLVIDFKRPLVPLRDAAGFLPED